MAAPLSPTDLQLFDESISEDVATAMIASVWARACKLAPCLRDKDWEDEANAEDMEIVKDVLRRVALRWFDTGSGAVTERQASDFSESLTSEYSGGRFRPDEINDLVDVCATGSRQAATTIATWLSTAGTIQHADWCSINFENNTDVPTLCDCGAEISGTGLPLWSRP